MVQNGASGKGDPFMAPPIKCGAASLLSSILSWLGHNVLFHKDAHSPSSVWRASDGVKSGCSADGVKSGCSFNCLIGHVFLNPRGFRPWQLAEEHGLALERQAEEHHRSEAEQNHPRPTAATCVNSNTFGKMGTK